MRLLVVSPAATHPQDEDDGLRAQALLARLRRLGHAVDLVVAPRHPLPAGALDAMRATWDRVVVVPPGRGSGVAPPGAVLGLDDWLPPALEPALRDLTARQGYDAVLVRHLHLSRALESVAAGPLRVLLTSGIAASGVPATGFRTSWAEEARGLNRADLVLAPDEEDRALLQAITRKPVAVLGFAPTTAPRVAGNGSRIGLIAGGDLPGVRAASRFLAATNLAGLADAGRLLRVSGAVAARLGGAREGLELLPDAVIAPDDLDLLVCPAEAATHLPAMAVQALARGVPLIGTAVALRSLPACSPWHAAPDAAAVAALARRWLSSAETRAAVAADSAELARRHEEEVKRQYAAFRDAASLRALLARPRALAITARSPGDEGGRLGAFARAMRGHLDLDVLLLGAASREEAPSPVLLGARGRVLRVEGQGTAEAAARDACASASYDLLLLDDEDPISPRAADARPMIRALDAEPGRGPPSLDRCAHLAAFDVLFTRSPGQQVAIGAALPGRTWYLPSAGPDLPCPDRAGPVRRIALIADETPAEATALRWFLDQAWPALMPDGRELLVTGRVGPALPDPLPSGVVLADAGANDPLATANLAVNLVTEGPSVHITREFLVRGLPCVLSEAAAEEIGGGEGQAFLVARSRAELVAHLQTLADRPAYRRAVGEAAFRLGRTRFGQPATAAAARDLADLALSLRPAA